MNCRTVLKYVWKTVATLLSAALALVVLTNISPMYDFEAGCAFSGPDIYNPYERMDSTYGWTRTNLHTHTHATSWINECEFYPDSVKSFYERFGYDLVSFSNHMELTPDPVDTTGQIWVYEHGYGFAKYHNLVFNPKRVRYHDIMFPVTASQKQFKLDMLLRGADFVFFNHPDRTSFTDDRDMGRLTGYRLLEADSEFSEWSTDGHKWDVALSSGHYVPSAISDDLHQPRRSDRIARRCSFLNTRSCRYEDVKECLLSGNFYTMHLPDFGNGDWAEKTERNLSLPRIVSIGTVDRDSTFMNLSCKASEIQVIGQDGTILESLRDSGSAGYRFREEDSYVRYLARFGDGVVVYSNPFARWDAQNATCDTPYRDFDHPVNWLLTILYNLGVLALAALILGFAGFVLKKK